MLREIGVRNPAPIDWAGNATFAGGLVLVMIGITYGIRPHGGQPMGWTSPFVLACICVGVALLAAFAIVEAKVAHPMFKLALFRIRPFTFGVLSSFLAAVARGGLDVHAHHLAAGHLAAATRVQLRARRRSGRGSTCSRSRSAFS